MINWVYAVLPGLLAYMQILDWFFVGEGLEIVFEDNVIHDNILVFSYDVNVDLIEFETLFIHTKFWL